MNGCPKCGRGMGDSDECSMHGDMAIRREVRMPVPDESFPIRRGEDYYDWLNRRAHQDAPLWGCECDVCDAARVIARA